MDQMFTYVGTFMGARSINSTIGPTILLVDLNVYVLDRLVTFDISTTVAFRLRKQEPAGKNPAAAINPR